MGTGRLLGYSADRFHPHLANDGRLSRAGGHGGAVGEERVVDVCVSVIYVKMPDLFWRGLREGSWVGMVQRLAAVIRH